MVCGQQQLRLTCEDGGCREPLPTRLPYRTPNHDITKWDRVEDAAMSTSNVAHDPLDHERGRCCRQAGEELARRFVRIVCFAFGSYRAASPSSQPGPAGRWHKQP